MFNKIKVEDIEIDTASLLIEVIQNYVFLYDLSHKDYKNKKKKDVAWREISLILNMSVDDCMKLWKNLRDRYTREKRGKPMESAAEESSNWPYFDKMIFYSKYSRPRKTRTTIAVHSDSVTERRRSTSCSSTPSVWSAVDAVFSGSTSEGEEERETAVAPTKEETSKSSKSGKAKRKRDVEGIEEVLKIVKGLAQSVKPPPKIDVNRTFIEYVHSRLSEMGEDEAKQKRKAMLHILEN